MAGRQPERGDAVGADELEIGAAWQHRTAAAGNWQVWFSRLTRTGVPVVDGVAAAVTIAESLVRLGLRTSKVRTYAPPRPKRITGFPLTGLSQDG